MNKNARNLIIAVVLVIGIGGFVYAQKEASLTSAPVNETATTTEAVPVAGTDSEAVSESATPPVPAESDAPSVAEIVATHNTRSSCWALINGSVYDLTSWIPRHPGGEGPILALCGTDGSARFNAKHGGQARPQTALAGFRINPNSQ